MAFDPLRCAEATGQAAFVLGIAVFPVAWRGLDGAVGAVLAGMLVITSAGIYALHAVTFDSFRILNSRAAAPVSGGDDGPLHHRERSRCSDLSTCTPRAAARASASSPTATSAPGPR
ncbi:hypothetical protein Ade02nite_52820 [Paractinoplanes deccanensis]|uniref:Amino acid transporter transmembrane domain-containing protein n=1 Tax=Paractinoplanes deccanensis TaxID=113561 RepID=A0ABQ3Y9G2_9ACTN|nr:hypothetical protein Ade02nite_52820 [Actinoplanes deccanensis]